MPERGKGFDGQAIFVRATNCTWGTAPTISGDFTDRLDLLSESMDVTNESVLDPTLQGRADPGCQIFTGQTAGGSVNIWPAFDRIGRPYAIGMGFENYDSPITLAATPELSGHCLEPSNNLHCEIPASGELEDCDTSGYTTEHIVRKAHLLIHKGGSNVEEFRDSMVQSINLSITSGAVGTAGAVLAPYRKLKHPGYPTSGWRIQAGESLDCGYLLFANTQLILQPYDASISEFNTDYIIELSEVTFEFGNTLATGADRKTTHTGLYNPEPIRNAHRTGVLTFNTPILKANMPGRYVDFEDDYLAGNVRYMGRLRVTGDGGREFTLIFPNLMFRKHSSPMTGPENITVSAELDVLGGREPTTDWGIFQQYISDGLVWTNAGGLLKGFYLYLVNDYPYNYFHG